MRTKLTPAFCQKATAKPGAERTIYWDGELPGFGLVVTKGGHRSYVVQYRAAGRSRRITVDGVLNLLQARRRAKILLGEVANEKDPLQDRRRARQREGNTFEKVADEYLARDGKALRTVDQRRAMLKRLVHPQFGARPVMDIRRSDVVKLLDKIEDENGPVMADRVLATIRKIMNWHARRSDEFRSPIVRGMARTSGKERARARILNDDELRALWKAATETPGPFGALIKFLLLTAARRGEAKDLRWSEIHGSDWILPAERNKVKIELVRPLSREAQNLLTSLPRIGRKGYVFTIEGDTPLGAFSKFKCRLDKRTGISAWTLHDLRRTARSLMSRAGVSSDHAERCLGHVMAGVRGTYDRHEFYEEKKQAYEALAAQIDRIINPRDNVVQLRATQELPA